MKPVRIETMPSQAIGLLQDRFDQDERVRLRVTRFDGTVTEGEFAGADAEFSEILVARFKAITIPVRDIAVIHVRVARREREWFVAIVAGFASMVLLGRLVTLDLTESQQLFVFAGCVLLAGAMMLLAKHRVFQGFVARWAPLLRTVPPDINFEVQH